MSIHRHGVARLLLSLLVLVLLGAAVAGAEGDSATEEIAATSEAAAEPWTAALRVVVDPETGRLRAPTAEEAAALATPGGPSIAAESLPVEEAADGTLTVRLGALYLKAASAHVAADGEVEVHHDTVPVAVAPKLAEPATADDAELQDSDDEEGR